MGPAPPTGEGEKNQVAQSIERFQTSKNMRNQFLKNIVRNIVKFKIHFCVTAYGPTGNKNTITILIYENKQLS